MSIPAGRAAAQPGTDTALNASHDSAAAGTSAGRPSTTTTVRTLGERAAAANATGARLAWVTSTEASQLSSTKASLSVLVVGLMMLNTPPARRMPKIAIAVSTRL